VIQPLTARKADPALEQELLKAFMMSEGWDPPFEEVERFCAPLLQQYTDAESQGLIYVTLAKVYANRDIGKRPDKVVEYAEKAVDLPIDPVDRLMLYTAWGDAIQVSNRGVHGDELARAGREAVMPYLYGLRETLDCDLPEGPPPVPRIRSAAFVIARIEDPERRKAAIARQQELVAAQRRAILQGDMILHRGILSNQVVHMYTRFPFATEELRELATGVLQDEMAVRRLVDAVVKGISQRLLKSAEVDLDPATMLTDIGTMVDPPTTLSRRAAHAEPEVQVGVQPVRGPGEGTARPSGVAPAVPRAQAPRWMVAAIVGVVLVAAWVVVYRRYRGRRA
jgi:hypothetical protein